MNENNFRNIVAFGWTLIIHYAVTQMNTIKTYQRPEIEFHIFLASPVDGQIHAFFAISSGTQQTLSTEGKILCTPKENETVVAEEDFLPNAWN
jgi:hypothetical protein